MGKSRSTTLLIAYLLSKHPHYTPKSTLALIRRTRPFAEPNDGFMRQLTLYHDMHCPSSIDPHPLYQRWLYQRDVEASLACGVAPDTIRFGDEIGGSAVVGTPGEEEGPELDRGKEKVEFRCRRCRTSLSTSQYLISHTPFPDKPTNNIATIRQTPISSLPASTATQRSPCAHLFLEPLSWMRPELEQGKLDGRLECPNPKCKTNVGKYAWQGMKCSCGEWVVPGISIARGRVDEMKVKKGSLGKVGKI
ncbi:tyrosine protein phosphatase yvh1 [Toensbergia leucococca]|nr:tyrosine protein phosphatase yvh1 [Toensbergia leucococca]